MKDAIHQNRRKDMSEEIRKAGFDIKTEAEHLESLYETLLHGIDSEKKCEEHSVCQK